MENSQWLLVLTNTYMSRGFTPLKGVIINVTIVKGACSHSRCLLSGRKETRLAPGERVAFNTEIFGWMGEGGFGPEGRTIPLGKGGGVYQVGQRCRETSPSPSAPTKL